jgi:hypothetical protein
MSIHGLAAAMPERVMTSMRLADKAVVHQVHPVKIGADVTASVISNTLLWKGRPKPAITVRLLLPVAGSLAVLSLADLDPLAASQAGRYVLAHRPASAQAVRLAGDALMGLGAHRRSAALLMTGALVIAAGWSHAAWPANHRLTVNARPAKDLGNRDGGFE